MASSYRRTPIISSWACLGLLGGLLVGGWTNVATAQSAAQDRQLLFETLNRVEQLEEEIRQLRGELEVYRYRQEELERRLQAGGADTGGSTAATRRPPPTSERSTTEPSPPPPVSTAPPDTPPPRQDTQPPPRSTPYNAPTTPPGAATAPPGGAADEQGMYDEAFKRLQEGRYEEAIQGFEAFLRAYPSGGLAGNAQYWLGEAYYVNRDFNNAKTAFINVGVSYPNSDKLPDALLKLGYIYDDLGDKAKAREVLQKLVQTYPNTQAASLGEKRLRNIR